MSLKNNVNTILVKTGFLHLKVYRLSTIINIVSSVFYVIVQYFLWKAIYSSNNIGIYEFDNMILYLFIGQIITTIYPSNVSHNINVMVKDGDISMHLLKPISIEREIFFEELGKSLYLFITTSIPTVVIVFVFLRVNICFSLGRFISFLVLISLAYIFTYYFEMCIGSLSFLTSNLVGLSSLKFAIITLASGKFLPIAFYPVQLRRVIELLPFKMMYSTPIEYLLSNNNSSFTAIIIQEVVYIFIAICLYRVINRLSLKRLMIQGG